MASYFNGGDQTLAQVRKKVNGVVVFSESKLFATEALAKSWGTRLEANLKQEGIAAVSNRRISLGELVLEHLKYQQSSRPLGHSTIQTHEYIAPKFRNLSLVDQKAKHLIDFARRRHAEGVEPATVLSNLSPCPSRSAQRHGRTDHAGLLRRRAVVRIRRGTAIGLAQLGGGAFQHQPPLEQELESAIDFVEDAVMPLAKVLPKSTRLVSSDAIASRLLAVARRAPGQAPGVLTLEEVEHATRP